MKVELATLFLAAAAPLVSAHYTFSGLYVNGQMVGGEWQYIRQHTRGYMPTFKEEAATSVDFRCNQGAASGANTAVYTVKPGDKVALRQAFGAKAIEHPGPAQVYMSKAPGSVQSYDGAGDWFKVHQALLCRANGPNALQNNAWCVWGEDRIEFTVPSNIPSGEYLARVEHIALHGAHAGKAEFYYACAQLKVEGGSGWTIPGPTVKIPGVYQTGDAPINFSVWSGQTTYPTPPGPAVASGGTTRGSADGTSSATIKVAKRENIVGEFSGSPAAVANAIMNA